MSSLVFGLYICVRLKLIGTFMKILTILGQICNKTFYLGYSY